MITALILLIGLPVIAGCAQFLASSGAARRIIPLVMGVSLCAACVYFFRAPGALGIALIGEYSISLKLSGLATFILVMVNIFGFVISLYAQDDAQVKNSRVFFACCAFVIASSNMVCLAGDFLSLMFAWGATLVLLYAMLKIGSDASATKAVCVVGFGDFCFILGACIYIAGTGSTILPSGARTLINNPYSWSAFLLMLAGAFAKAGCGPLHTWIPVASESAPLPVMSLLPASIDKLLGIYLLARVCNDFFVINHMAQVILLVAGSATIMFAVMMALIQHDLRKLLAYHAISQVGYMVIGFGTASALGIAGAIFHMANHAVYKSGLFLTGGSVGQKKGTFELDQLGGLAKYMPVTFAAGLVFALSISGIPPLNGFASKWMLYQAIFGGIVTGGSPVMSAVFVVTLAAAMFGSVLTLASFIKFIHAVFLGQERNPQEVREVPGKMRFAVVILAGLCIAAGVFPGFIVKHCIEPSIPGDILALGSWNSIFVAAWILIGLAVGIITWRWVSASKVRKDGYFIGGETAEFRPRFPATEFYRTFEDIPVVRRLYAVIKAQAFDLYTVLCRLSRICAYAAYIALDRLINLITIGAGYAVLACSGILRGLHTGTLDLYLIWSLAGLLVIVFAAFGS